MDGLETVHQSFRWYTMGNDMDKGIGSSKTFAPLREDIITHNMQYLITKLNGKPILGFYGASHAAKIMPYPNPPVEDFKSWAQRLSESGIDVYSLYVTGIAGDGYWRDESIQYPDSLGQFQFKDDSFLSSLFESHLGAGIIYADLRAEENKSIKLPPDHLDIPASQAFDGLVLYKEYTPMENACSE
jgi:hypothetical protein